jgi:hypothetical protein
MVLDSAFGRTARFLASHIDLAQRYVDSPVRVLLFELGEMPVAAWGSLLDGIRILNRTSEISSSRLRLSNHPNKMSVSAMMLLRHGCVSFTDDGAHHNGECTHRKCLGREVQAALEREYPTRFEPRQSANL